MYTILLSFLYDNPPLFQQPKVIEVAIEVQQYSEINYEEMNDSEDEQKDNQDKDKVKVKLLFI